MSEPGKHQHEDLLSGPPRARLRYLSQCMTGGLSGWTLWHYASDFALGQIADAGFFEDAADMLREGDFLAVSAKDGGALLYVQSIRGGGVVTQPMASADAGDARPPWRAFLGVYHKLRTVDRNGVKFLGDRDWDAFREGPLNFLTRTDDETADRIWRAAFADHGQRG